MVTQLYQNSNVKNLLTDLLQSRNLLKWKKLQYGYVYSPYE
jgi:hypothetical protein